MRMVRVLAVVLFGSLACIAASGIPATTPGGQPAGPPGNVVYACTEATCDDGNVCTTDVCESDGVCTHTNNTNLCDDGNACTVADTCGDGACQPGSPLNCDDSNVCTTDSCTAATGCIYSANSAPCDDGNACTLGDVCANGVCLPGAEVMGCDDNNVCTTDSCNPPSGCVHTNNTNSCSDGNACTDGDKCADGACNPGALLSCDDSNVCTSDGCSPVTGCVHASVMGPSWGETFDGYAADSQLIGQGGWSGWNDNPDVGALVSTSRALSAPNSVVIRGTSDVVRQFDDLTSGRWSFTVWQFAPNDMTGVCYLDLLNRYDPSGRTTSRSTQVRFDATQNLVINTGVSHGSIALVKGRWVAIRVEIDLAADTQAFYYDDHLVFRGSWTSELPDSGPLAIAAVNMVGNRSSSVFYDDFGIAGTSCDDSNVCTTDSCNPAAGCVHVDNTTTCSDGNACTTGDTCGGGVCNSGTPVACNDDNPCTDDTCSVATGCVYMNNTAICDDGNPCTMGDVCSGGTCAGTPTPAPPETQSVIVAADKATFSWSAASDATQYDVVRGSTGAFPVGPGGGDEVCFDNLVGPTLVDATMPAPDKGFWYLSRGENACGSGTYGFQGLHGAPGASRVTTTCP